MLALDLGLLAHTHTGVPQKILMANFWKVYPQHNLEGKNVQHFDAIFYNTFEFVRK